MPAKKAAPVKIAAQATVTLKHLAATLAEDHEMPKKQAEAVLTDLVTLTTRHLKKGDKIGLTGIGRRLEGLRVGCSSIRPAVPRAQ
jgi:DNA-binding protein HU-beta